MMSMEMSDDNGLLSGRRSGRMINFWRSRTGMERVLLVVTAVLGVTLFGFIIGVASLNKTRRSTETNRPSAA